MIFFCFTDRPFSQFGDDRDNLLKKKKDTYLRGDTTVKMSSSLVQFLGSYEFFQF